MNIPPSLPGGLSAPILIKKKFYKLIINKDLLPSASSLSQINEYFFVDILFCLCLIKVLKIKLNFK